MAWTFCTSGSAVLKAGANANSAIVLSGNALLNWSNEAEGRIVGETRTNFLASYASISTTSGIRNALAAVCSAIIATNIINYDMSGYTSRSEAQTMLNVLDNEIQRGLNELKGYNTSSLKSI